MHLRITRAAVTSLRSSTGHPAAAVVAVVAVTQPPPLAHLLAKPRSHFAHFVLRSQEPTKYLTHLSRTSQAHWLPCLRLVDEDDEGGYSGESGIRKRVPMTESSPLLIQ